ncbi:hypothetical protein HHK36_030692 [Tetracentron sinense]|uniref:Uncharacterized protein n=1 Tax=Tetracentron sinense TaxID=13715 RepID=A0A835CYI6_TETSI|nr:hypothetical protein HHK36_030692 [Tetracentron sinense]
MAARRERCNGCGIELLVPPEAQTFRCAVCQTITRARPNDPFGRAQEPVLQATSWFKGMINNMSSSINSVASSMNNNYSASPSPMPSYGYYPLPPRPQTYSASHGRKRALLCGVTYRWQSYELDGTINDVQCMRYFLVEKMGFPNDCILTLTEDEKDPYRIPTRRNIQMAFQWLVHGCQSGDSLVFHYAGHGKQQPDNKGEEIDGYDETICPLDFETEGMILDDEINATIVRPLPKGATLHAIIDSCHSGTVLDLPFLCRMNREGYYQWENHSPLSGAYKGTSGGLALSFSACDDNQTSASTTALSGTSTLTGAMTYSFIQAVQSEPGLTYGRVLTAMRSKIREANTGIRLNGPIASLIRKVLGTGLSQEPQLSSSERFDVYSRPFIL